MKSFAFMLGAAACLVGATALADESRYWEKRDVTPADEDKKPLRNYFESRDTNPGDPDDKREAEDYLNKRAEAANKPDRDHSMDRTDLKSADPDSDRFKSKVGVAIESGGGIGGFVDRSISETTGSQGQYTGRVVVGTRRHFAGEAAYVGSAQRVNTFGVSPGSMLYGNGVETAFRYNLLTGMWQPYATGGIGWMHYNFNRDAQISTSDVQQSGDVVTFPVGVGMAWRLDGLILDSRFSMHPATSSSMIRGANFSTWDLQARAGFEF